MPLCPTWPDCGLSLRMNRTTAHARRGHRRIPAFLPVPLRARADGWSPPRQAAFLAALALTRSVRAAAARVGMSRESAYRLRGRVGAASFAAAWDAALARKVTPSRKVTPATLAARATGVLLKPLLYAGRHVATVEKADNSALLRLLGQLDRHGRAGPAGQGDTSRFARRAASTPTVNLAGFGARRKSPGGANVRRGDDEIAAADGAQVRQGSA